MKAREQSRALKGKERDIYQSRTDPWRKASKLGNLLEKLEIGIFDEKIF